MSATDSVAADLRLLAERIKAGSIEREQHLEERSRVRSRLRPSRNARNKAVCNCKDSPTKGSLHGPEPQRAGAGTQLHQLQMACEEGDAPTLRASLHSNPGLDIDVLEDEGEMRSPLLHVAAENGSCECVRLLLDEGKVAVDALGEFGTTVLFDACYHGRAEVAAAVLQRGASVEFEDPDGCTSLYAAAYRGHLACLNLLISYKAKVYYHRAEDLQTPLHAAVHGGNEMCVARLAAAGHPLDVRDASGHTPLLAAANFGGAPCGSNGKKGCLLQLLDAGADAELVDGQGRSAMQLLLMGGVGCEHCTCVCAERLLEEHASVLQPDKYGKNAAEHIDELKKSSPKIHALIKDERAQTAAAAAAALLEAEEAEKAAAEAKRERKKQQQKRRKEHRHLPKQPPPSTPAEPLPLPASSALHAPPPRPPSPAASSTPAIPEAQPPLSVQEGTEQSVQEGTEQLQLEDGESETESEVREEIEAFRRKLEACTCPRKRITLDPAAFHSLRAGLKTLQLSCHCGSECADRHASLPAPSAAKARRGGLQRGADVVALVDSDPQAAPCATGSHARAYMGRGRRT